MGMGSSEPRPGRFIPENDTVPLVQEACRPQGRSARVRKISPPPGFDPRTVQPVAIWYTDWAISAASHEVAKERKIRRPHGPRFVDQNNQTIN